MSDHSDAQELFDDVVSHLYNQGEQARDIDGDLAYLGENGQKSPVGHRISSENYDLSIETHQVYDHEIFIRLTENDRNNFKLLKDLEYIHDLYFSNGTTDRLFYKKLFSLAKSNNLDVTVLYKLSIKNNYKEINKCFKSIGQSLKSLFYSIFRQ